MSGSITTRTASPTNPGNKHRDFTEANEENEGRTTLSPRGIGGERVAVLGADRNENRDSTEGNEEKERNVRGRREFREVARMRGMRIGTGKESSAGRFGVNLPDLLEFPFLVLAADHVIGNSFKIITHFLESVRVTMDRPCGGRIKQNNI